MSTYSLAHLPDDTLLKGLAAAAALERGTTAVLLAHIAEVDERKLYLPAGHSSMFAYCLGELHMSEDAAYRRISAARVARQFPAVFAAVADGRLHVTAVAMLKPYLAPDNSGELLEASAHKSKAQIERLLAERFPQPDVPTRVRTIAPPESPAPARVEQPALETPLPAPARVEPPAATRPKVTPLAPRRFALQCTIDESAYEDLRQAQALLAHEVGSGDVAGVIARALRLLVIKLEKRKFAATSKPRRGRASHDPRHIPAAVKRAVWERDQGRCTFVSESGRRCEAHHRLEFDHFDPVARGGRASVARIRLRCRAHNQYAAERMFGVEFMRRKREEARGVTPCPP